MTDSQYELAEIYLFGLYDVEKNTKLGLEFLKKATDKKHPLALKLQEDINKNIKNKDL